MALSQATLEELGLVARSPVVSVNIHIRALNAFVQMQTNKVSAVAITDDCGILAANISIRYSQLFLFNLQTNKTATDLSLSLSLSLNATCCWAWSDLRGLAPTDLHVLLLPVMDYLRERSPSARIPPVSFSPKTQFAKVVEHLAATRLHRVWIVVTTLLLLHHSFLGLLHDHQLIITGWWMEQTCWAGVPNWCYQAFGQPPFGMSLQLWLKKKPTQCKWPYFFSFYLN